MSNNELVNKGMSDVSSLKTTSAEAMDQAFNVESHRESYDVVYDDYRVRLENFDGPLDLLLHLVKKDQIDIHNIPVAHVCESYLNFLSKIASPDVNVAGEFFVMAATLLHLKSEMLLPEEPGEKENEDPRLPLVAQLIDYERFKKAAARINSMTWLGREVFARPESAASEIMPPEAILNGPVEAVGTYELLLGLKIAMDRTHRKPIQISIDATSIRDRVISVVPLIEGGNPVEFSRLLPEEKKRKDIIITFLAILELVRLKYIEITQFESLGPIYLRAIRPLSELNMELLEQF